MLLALLFACAPESATGTLSVERFDCEAACWEDATIEVPRRYWGPWIDQSSCDDGGVRLNYDGDCVATRDFCESDWADDPALGEVAACCDGAFDVDAADVACVDMR